MSETTKDVGRVELRLAESDDVETLQSVFERAGDHFLRITGRATPEPDAARRELGSAASTPGREVALIERGGSGPGAVGAVGWWAGHPEPDVALLGMLMVVAEERRRGIAGEALRLLEARLRDAGITRLRTAVGAEDRAASTFLEAVGFASMDQRTHVDVDSGRLRIAFFEKTL